MNRLGAAIAALTLLRLVVAATTPLAPDEAYYWVWSQALAPGYLDHPPMVALWIRAGTFLAGQTALGVRLLGPLASALASWMLFDAGRVLFPGSKAGLIAVVLLNTSLLLGVGSVIMTPDSPLLFFWTATLWALAQIAGDRHAGWWLVAGVFAGLALDSKYTALLLWAGVALWLLLVPAMRFWLRRWQPWAAGAVGLAVFAPVVAWNAAHHWVGFIKQSGRVNDWHPWRALGFLTELLGSQIGLVTPLIWLLFMAGLCVAIRHTWRSRPPGWALLTALSLPAILVFVQHAVGDRVQGNWPAIIYPALALAAGMLAVKDRWWIGASGLGLTITVLAYLQATTGILPLPARLDPTAIRLAGWSSLSQQIRNQTQASGAAFVAADGYALASELAWWLPGDIPVLGADERWNLFNLPPAHIAGLPGLLVQDARLPTPVADGAWRDIQRMGVIQRPGGIGPDYAVYRVMAVKDEPKLRQ